MKYALPPQILQLVLQHVDPPQRLGPCALVCRAWHAAANAATTSVSSEGSVSSVTAGQRRATALSDWLQRQGGEVEQLQFAGSIEVDDIYRHEYKRPDIALPWRKLTKLENLAMCKVNVCPINSDGCKGSAESCSSRGSCSGSPGPQQQPLAALTRLTQLYLLDLQWTGSLQPLFALTSLRQLHFHGVTCVGYISPTEGASGTFDAAIGELLSHLVQLTSLRLNYVRDAPMGVDDSEMSDASLAYISRLQQLQDLEIRGLYVLTPGPARLAALQQSLTRLELHEIIGVVLSSSTTPTFAQLTALQHLELAWWWTLEPVLLSQMTQLTCLCLNYGKIVPAGSAGVAALLAAVASMTLLQHLELRCLESHAPAAAYAALTASSHLTCLRFGNGYSTYFLIPGGALHHMFAAGRQLPGLKELCVCFKQEQQQQQQVVVPDSWALRQQGFDQLLQCCPGLRNLQLRIDVVGEGPESWWHQPPIRLDGLLALSGLTWLEMWSLLVDEDGTAKTLAHLTDLRHLTVYHTGVKYTSLLQLTQLKQLGGLVLRSAQEHLFFGGVYRWDPPQPPVWQQLQERCVRSCSECARLVLMQLQEAQEQLAEARQQLAAQQAQLAAQQAQHEAQLADARQQLVAQQAQHEAQLADARQQLISQQAQHEAQLAQLQQHQQQ